MDIYHALPPMSRRGPDAVNDDLFDFSLKISCPRSGTFSLCPESTAGQRTACMPPHAVSDTPEMRVPIEELFLPGGDSSGRR
jgi:hypothetical protein